MSTPYLQMLGHAFLTTHTADRTSRVESELANEGFGESDLSEGRQLVQEGIELFDRRAEEVVDERITLHAVHAAAEEVGMWHQTAEFRLKESVTDDEVVAKAVGYDIHADDHNLEVVAKALRMLGMIRTSEAIHDELGTDRSVLDLIIRGNTLLDKLVDIAEKWMSPSHVGDPDATVFSDLEASRLRLTEWLQRFDKVVDDLEERPELLGEIGYVPDDVGLPMGGTGYSITLHERSERHPPDPSEEPKRDPGWTIGRQGRNDENMGKGWVQPTFD